MSEALERRGVHPEGEEEEGVQGYREPHKVETLGGMVEVRWVAEPGMTMNGPLIYFVEFLVKSGRWKRWGDTCPLEYQSPNAPSKDEILATMLLSVMSGHRRYAHITGLRGDGVMASMLGVKTLRSEDSVRGAFEKTEEEKLTLWMDLNLGETYEALLNNEWILDLDATVKRLYGRHGEARVGYNAAKPGGPTHVQHALLLARAKLVLKVEVQAGNQTASVYGQDGLWGWLEERDRQQWPARPRGAPSVGGAYLVRLDPGESTPDRDVDLWREFTRHARHTPTRFRLLSTTRSQRSTRSRCSEARSRTPRSTIP